MGAQGIGCAGRQVRTEHYGKGEHGDNRCAAGRAGGSTAKAARRPVRVRRITATVSDPAFSSQWALEKIAWGSAFHTAKPKRRVTIAVLDTGVDGANRDFAGRVTGGFSAVGSKPTTDPNGHGTWMAGIAAAAANNRYGIAGVAFADARIMP